MNCLKLSFANKCEHKSFKNVFSVVFLGCVNSLLHSRQSFNLTTWPQKIITSAYITLKNWYCHLALKKFIVNFFYKINQYCQTLFNSELIGLLQNYFACFFFIFFILERIFYSNYYLLSWYSRFCPFVGQNRERLQIMTGNSVLS